MSPHSTLFQLAAQGNLEKLRLALETENNINIADDGGYTLLHWAAQEGQLETILYLVDKGIHINAQDTNGFAPFHIAVNQGHSQLVEYFLSAGIDVNTKCQANNNSALHNAAIWNHLDIATLLIQNGANTNTIDAQNHTPLTEAALSGNLDIATLLINNGASIELAKKNGLSKQDLTGRSKSEMAKLLAL